MSFDVNHDDDARRLWMIGLDLARHTDHPQGSDLTVYLLADMALQAVHLDRPDEALKLAHLGQAAAIGSHPVSSATTGLLAGIQARAHAAQGDATGCDRALGQAVELCAAIDPATAPPWTAYLSDTGVSGHQGAAHYALALPERDPVTANRAVALLRRLVSVGPDYSVFRATYLPDLAGAHALAGDIDTAVSIGHRAVDAVTAVRSPRAHETGSTGCAPCWNPATPASASPSCASA